MRYSTLNFTDLSIDVAREYVADTLLPEAFALTIGDNHQESTKDILQWLYKMSKSSSRSTI
jgi:hypothetical protein